MSSACIGWASNISEQAHRLCQTGLVKAYPLRIGTLERGTSEGTTTALRVLRTTITEERVMRNIIYIIGLIVVVLAVLSFFGLR